LKKITGLNRVKLVDAGFIWTEPHSRRLKVKLTIQKEVLNGVRLQQVLAIEFLIQNQQCDTCQRSYTEHVWRAMVQVRQKVDHKKTFFLLEQLILKHNAHDKCISIDQVPTGVDFAFGEKSHAVSFINFLSSVVPIKTQSAKQLISEDEQNALKRYKFAFCIDIVPLCKDDLVMLPYKIASAVGNINPLSLVSRVANQVYLVDPRTLQTGEMTGDKYWRDPFRPMMDQRRLEEFTVLDVTPVVIAPITGTALRRKQGSKKGSTVGGASGAASGKTHPESMNGFTGSVAGGVTTGASLFSGSIAGSRFGFDAGSNAMTAGNMGASARRAAAARERFSELKSLASGANIAALTGAASAAGSAAQQVAGKRKRDGGDDDDDDAKNSVYDRAAGGAMSVGGGKSTYAGGFTGAVSLAGGSVQWHNYGASTVASTVTGGPKGKLMLADAEVMKTSEMGVEGSEQTRFFVRTHLGNLLRPGDTVLGYDLRNAVYNDCDAESAAIGGKSQKKGTGGRGKASELPDIVLVRKVYPKKGDRRTEEDFVPVPSTRPEHQQANEQFKSQGKVKIGAATAMDADEAMGDAAAAPKTKRAQRVWKLKRLGDVLPTHTSEGGMGPGATAKGGNKRGAAGANTGYSAGDEAGDFESFLRDIEQDPALRKTINLYKDHEAIQAKERRRREAEEQRKLGIKASADGSDGESSDGEADGEGAGEGDIGLEELLDDMALNDGAAAASAEEHAPLPDGSSAKRARTIEACLEAGGEEDDDEDDLDLVGTGIKGTRARPKTIQEADEEDEASDKDL
jgi:NMD protein affecting ribosome stability and mRNA decay